MQDNLSANAEKLEEILQSNSLTKCRRNRKRSPEKKCQKKILQKKEKEK